MPVELRCIDSATSTSTTTRAGTLELAAEKIELAVLAGQVKGVAQSLEGGTGKSARPSLLLLAALPATTRPDGLNVVGKHLLDCRITPQAIVDATRLR